MLSIIVIISFYILSNEIFLEPKGLSEAWGISINRKEYGFAIIWLRKFWGKMQILKPEPPYLLPTTPFSQNIPSIVTGINRSLWKYLERNSQCKSKKNNACANKDLCYKSNCLRKKLEYCNVDHRAAALTKGTAV